MKAMNGSGRNAMRAVGTALFAVTVLLPGVMACGEEAAPKVIKKGGVRFYVEEKRIEIDGKICLAEGPLEYFAVAEGGKEYESVISLTVNPEILHWCLLLMRLKPGETGAKYQGDPENVPTGSPVTVKVKWTENGAAKVVPATALCWNALDKRPMEETPWVFVGSKMLEDPDTKKKVYWANVEKSVIDVYRDPMAVLSLPLAASANDESYVVNKQVVPKKDTPVTVILEPGPEVKAPPKNAAGGRIVEVDVTGGGRALVDGRQQEELAASLRKIMKESPKDTCKVTVDHGAPVKAAARAFEALDAAGIRIESVETALVKGNVKDAMTVTVTGEKVVVNGKDASVEQVRLAAQALRGEWGLTVKMEAGGALKTLVSVLRACEGNEGAVLRIIWFEPK